MLRIPGRLFSSSVTGSSGNPLTARIVQYLESLSARTNEVSNYSNPSKEDLKTVQLFRTLETPYQNLKQNLQDIQELNLILSDEKQDNDFRALAKSDIDHIHANNNSLLETITDFLVPNESFDRNNAVMEVIPGAGGLEASLFAEEIFQLYCSYMDHLGFQVTLLDMEKTSVGKNTKLSSTTGIHKAKALIEGKDVFKIMKYECGVHRVQRVPITGTKSDRLQTSTCSVAILPEPDEADIDLPERDLKFEFCRSSGAGGQNVNKVDSACKVTHIPTGKIVECQEDRTALNNKKKAVAKLRAEMFHEKFDAEMKKLASSRKFQIGNMNRNEKIRTYNFTRHSITDHRIGQMKQVPNISQFFTGAFGFDILDNFYKQLDNETRQERLLQVLSSVI